MHMVVFIRSFFCCPGFGLHTHLLQHTGMHKKDQAKRRHVSHRSMGACGASFLCASFLQRVCLGVGDDVFLVATWNLFVIFFTKCRMPLLRAFSCRSSVSPEPSAARMPLLILWLSPTGYCCRERDNSLIVLECTSRRVWFLCSNYCERKQRQPWDRGFHRNSSLQAAWDTSILYET